MESGLLEQLKEWIDEARDHLQAQGWNVTLTRSALQDSVKLELEGSYVHGRIELQSTGQMALTVLDKTTGSVGRGECEVYTEEQLADAIHQFFGWMVGETPDVPRVECPDNKDGYLTRGEAHVALDRVTGKLGMTSGIEIYKCRKCPQYHLTGAGGNMQRRSFPDFRRRRGRRKK